MNQALVLIQKLDQSPNGLKNLFKTMIEELFLNQAFESAKAIFIKPNLTYPKYKKGVTTRIEFIEALVSALREINSTTKIYIGEGEGGYNAFAMSGALENMGYFDLEKKYANVEIVNISKIPSKKVELKANGKPYIIELPLLFDEVDFSISCPVPKVHCMTGITLSFKNQWGCVPDIMRLKNHYVFDEIISQIGDKLKFRYAFLDGKYGLDDNGPMVGTPVELNWFAASDSLGAFDMIVSEMMGVKWEKIGHLKTAQKYGYLPRREDVRIVGDIASMKRKFKLKRTFWNYPALIAFKSKSLTHIVYFSKIAKVLHDIMYTFRKRPIND
jgi:uncharacterized protein (DUF362 family)